MKRLCFGTLFKILCQARANGVKEVPLCEFLFNVYNLKVPFEEYSKRITISKLKSGDYLVPKVIIEKVRNFDIELATENYHKNIIPYIDPNLYECVIASIIEVIKDDNTIGEKTIIGCEGYSKEEILNNKAFEISSFLATTFKYAISNVNNKECKKSIAEIKKDYVDSFKKASKGIVISPYDISNESQIPLARTINDEKFKQIFKEVSTNKINGLINPSKLSVYKFDVQNNRFRYYELEKYLMNHISEYVNSRTQISTYRKNEEIPVMVVKAFKKFVSNTKTNKNSILGELLLYVFLEQELNAPKLMSKFELSDNNTLSQSDGIHLLFIPTKNGEIHQVVFGASNIIDDPYSAIDKVFNKINKVRNNEINEFGIIDSAIVNQVVDEKTANFIKRKFSNSKNDNDVDNAYGVFIGYKVGVKDNLTKSQYIDKLNKQLNKDAKDIEKYILKKIKEENMHGYSFYVYLVPFNDATKEKVQIVEELIREG